MSKKKSKKAQDKRTPPTVLVLDFMKLHNIVIVNDITNVTVEKIPGVYYETSLVPRTRYTYKDMLKKEEEPKIDYAN